MTMLYLPHIETNICSKSAGIRVRLIVALASHHTQLFHSNSKAIHSLFSKYTHTMLSTQPTRTDLLPRLNSVKLSHGHKAIILWLWLHVRIHSSSNNRHENGKEARNSKMLQSAKCSHICVLFARRVCRSRPLPRLWYQNNTKQHGIH